MRCIDMFRTLKQAMLAAGIGLAIGAAAQANIIITEVAPWSSGNSPLEADWFELTNTGAAAVDITGWKVDDNPGVFGSSLALTGITSIAAGESVIFVEQANDDDAPAPAEYVANFKSLWFGSNVPAGLQIGTYQGSGIGLSGSGDQVNIFNAGGTNVFGVAFGASPASAPFTTFDNAAGVQKPTLLNTPSTVGVNGAFSAFGDPTEIGSPGTIVTVPEPASLALIGVALAAMVGFTTRRSAR